MLFPAPLHGGAPLQGASPRPRTKRRPWPVSGGKSFAEVSKLSDGGRGGAHPHEGPQGPWHTPAGVRSCQQRALQAGASPEGQVQGRPRRAATGVPEEHAGTRSLGTASPCLVAVRPACPAEGSGAQPWRQVLARGPLSPHLPELTVGRSGPRGSDTVALTCPRKGDGCLGDPPCGVGAPLGGQNT